jgi:hypothetical protein
MKGTENNEENFSLTENGFITHVLKKFNIEHKRGLLAIFILCLTWLPLVIITSIDGTLYSGTGLPFLKDLAIQGRLLVGIFMLILIKHLVYRQIPQVLHYIAEVLIPPNEKERFISGPLLLAKKRTDSKWSEIILVLGIAIFAFSPADQASLFMTQRGSGTWLISLKDGKEVLSFAGKWAQYISIPIFQFLLLRWLWRYLVWVILLFHISKENLILKPTHPDGSGGIGIIFLAQRNFLLFFVACGMAISCVMINFLLQTGISFETLKIQILGFIIFSIIMIILPLFFFIRKLAKTKYDGQLELSRAGLNMSKKYEEEWVKPMGTEKNISEDTVDPSIQVDYAGVYSLLQELRIIPIRLGDLMIMAFALYLPFIPIFFIEFSVVELLQKLMGLLV